MDPIANVKRDIDQMIGINGSDADAFWALASKCSKLALAPTIAAGLKWGPGIVAAGTVTLPGLGTVSGATATILMMSGVWASNTAACMSILPGLLKFRDDLKGDPALLSHVRSDVRRLVSTTRTTQPA